LSIETWIKALKLVEYGESDVSNLEKYNFPHQEMGKIISRLCLQII
jgi:hypothetical protein